MWERERVQELGQGAPPKRSGGQAGWGTAYSGEASVQKGGGGDDDERW